MRHTLHKIARVGLIFIILILLFPAKEVSAGEKLSLTVPPGIVEKHDRIARFKVTIVSAWVVSLPKIPPGWSIYIQNGSASKTVVDGGITAGAHAEYIDFFKDFMILQKFDKEWIPFNVELEIVTLTALEKYPSEKDLVPIVLKMKDIVMRKVEQ